MTFDCVTEIRNRYELWRFYFFIYLHIFVNRYKEIVINPHDFTLLYIFIQKSSRIIINQRNLFLKSTLNTTYLITFFFLPFHLHNN